MSSTAMTAAVPAITCVFSLSSENTNNRHDQRRADQDIRRSRGHRRETPPWWSPPPRATGGQRMIAIKAKLR